MSWTRSLGYPVWEKTQLLCKPTWAWVKSLWVWTKWFKRLEISWRLMIQKHNEQSQGVCIDLQYERGPRWYTRSMTRNPKLLELSSIRSNVLQFLHCHQKLHHVLMTRAIRACHECTATMLYQTDHMKATSFWYLALCQTSFQFGKMFEGDGWSTLREWIFLVVNFWWIDSSQGSGVLHKLVPTSHDHLVGSNSRDWIAQKIVDKEHVYYPSWSLIHVDDSCVSFAVGWWCEGDDGRVGL